MKHDAMDKPPQKYSFPQAMTAANRWLVRRIFAGTDSKQPCSPLAECPADYKPTPGEKPNAWKWRWQQRAIQVTLAEAVAYVKANRSECDGLSFCVHPGNETEKQPRIICVDFDDAFDADGKPWPWIQLILDVADSFVEYSRSGEGLHLFIRVDCVPFTNLTHHAHPEGGAIEVLCNSQIAVTGRVFGNPCEISDVPFSFVERLPFFQNRETVTTDADLNFHEEWWGKNLEGLSDDAKSLTETMSSWEYAYRDPGHPCDSHKILITAACWLARRGIVGNEAVELMRLMPVDIPWSESELKHKAEEAWKITNGDGTFDSIALASADGSEFGDLKPADPDEWTLDLSEDAFKSCLGQYVKADDEFTEADKNLVLIRMKSMLGNTIGRRAYFTVNRESHYPKINVVAVGGTGEFGRKGSAYINALSPFVIAAPDWLSCIETNFQSGEAIISRNRDPEQELIIDELTGQPDPLQMVFLDKRCLWYSPEFAEPLVQAKREGSTTSIVIRRAWDDVILQRNVCDRKDSFKASRTHITIIGDITPEELLEQFDPKYITSGLANRFYFWFCKRRKRVDEDDWTPDFKTQVNAKRAELSGICAGKIKDALAWLESIQPAYSPDEKDGVEFHFGECCREIFRQFNRQYDDVVNPSAPITKLYSRRLAIVKRSAVCEAVLDQTVTVQAKHVAAAVAEYWYAKASAEFIFPSLTKSSGDKNLDALHAWSVSKGPVTIRDTVRNGPLAFRDAEAAETALNKLVSLGRGEWGPWQAANNGKKFRTFTPS